MMKILITEEIWKEGNMYVSYCSELDVAACGENLKHLKGSWKGYSRIKNALIIPKFIFILRFNSSIKEKSIKKINRIRFTFLKLSNIKP